MLKTVRSADGRDHWPFKVGSQVFRPSPVVRITGDCRLTDGFHLFYRIRRNTSVWKLGDFLAKDYRFYG